jgi:NADH:ubiquinone oxidoreductase subunit E
VHNDKLHKAQDKAKQAERARKEKLKEIVKKFNETQSRSINKLAMIQDDNYTLLKTNVQEIIDLIHAKGNRS